MSGLSVEPEFDRMLRELGLTTPDSVFTDSRFRVWRDIRERQNAVLDATISGEPVRLHLKRDKMRLSTPCSDEVPGLELLRAASIPCPRLVARATLDDGRTAVMTLDLAGMKPADASGLSFDRLFEPTVGLVARLHSAGLHHRDLYLNHLFVNPAKPDEIALLDAARVRRLPGWFRRRWIVKDLAQFTYSTRPLEVSPEAMDRWLSRYAELTSTRPVDRLMKDVARKTEWIARHDARLRRTAPERTASLEPR